ncbi:MAG: hypothetical protein VKI81_00270 [Synechococcaceae cyanobacterium]|nr:hypothetical protein [Synechococcaceae cyanobacterium]
MTFPRTAASRTHRSLSPPRLLAQVLGRSHRTSAAAAWPSAHGASAGSEGSGKDFTPALR